MLKLQMAEKNQEKVERDDNLRHVQLHSGDEPNPATAN
jgi:hypothetical protein